MPPVRRMSLAAGLVSATGLPVSSCATEREVIDPRPEVTSAGRISLIVETEAVTGQHVGVGMFGALKLVANRCVGFDFLGEPTLIQFPVGTVVTGHGQNLTIAAEGVELHLGDSFDAGGPGNVHALSHDLEEQLPFACRSYDVVPLDEFATS